LFYKTLYKLKQKNSVKFATEIIINIAFLIIIFNLTFNMIFLSTFNYFIDSIFYK